ncbi:hypothetical protein ABZW30_38860 [Kitasatospora sp. NPDC004669]|uniref:hypothetical protein n=1 Tax=Kitasatospora sp. NPDC004669 TaxID=3154555 RepID=UPI0033BE0183
MTLVELGGEIYHLLLQGRDTAVQLLDVCRDADSGFKPDLLAEQLRELVLQVPDPGRLSSSPVVGAGQVGLERGPADQRARTVCARRFAGSRVDLGEQVAVPAEEGVVHTCGASDHGHTHLGAVLGSLAEGLEDAFAPAF